MSEDESALAWGGGCSEPCGDANEPILGASGNSGELRRLRGLIYLQCPRLVPEDLCNHGVMRFRNLREFCTSRGRSASNWTGVLQPLTSAARPIVAWANRPPQRCATISVGTLLVGLTLLLLLRSGREPRHRLVAVPATTTLLDEEGYQFPVQFPLSFEDGIDGTCPRGWTCKGPTAVCKVGSSAGPCRPYPGIKGLDGKLFLDVGNDYGTASALSPKFTLPAGTDRICFKRSGGADANSGFYLVRLRDRVRICSAENGQNVDVFSEQCCPDLAPHVGEEVVIHVIDAQSSGWGKVLIDDIRILDSSGRNSREHREVPKKACGLVQDNVHYDGVHELTQTTTPTAEACCAVCEEHPDCTAWAWGKVRNNWLTDKCFLKKLVDGHMPHQVGWEGVISGLPAKSMRKVETPKLNASEYVQQNGAHFPAGSALKLYALGSSSMLWMNWVEELHLYLLRLGYQLPTVEAKVKPEFHPRSVQTCDDSMYFDRLRTARFARIGWCSWDYAFEGWNDCSDGFRMIGGHKVKCRHGPGCSHSTEPLWASGIAEDASLSDITLVATWFNDDQQRWSNYNCFDGSRVEKVEATQISIPSLLQTVRKIHSKNPHVWVVVLGKYPQVWGHFTYPWFTEVNVRVKAALKNEPRTLFIDYYMPPDNVTNLYQSAHPGHPNCRGSKLITLAVLRKLFEAGVLGRGLKLKEPTEENLVRSSCEGLNAAECHTSVVCWVDPGDGRCKIYGKGSHETHKVVEF